MFILWCTVPGLINEMLQMHTVYTFRGFKKENLGLDDLMNQVTDQTPFLKKLPSWSAANRAHIKLKSVAAEETGIATSRIPAWPDQRHNTERVEQLWAASENGTLWVGRWHNLEWHVE